MQKFTKPLFILFFLALSAFIFQGNMYSQDYNFEQQVENGLVVMEAENYTELIVQDGLTNWESCTEPDLFSGVGGMRAMPVDGSPYAEPETAIANSPIMSYKINFTFTGTMYVWIRECHEDKGDDSFHAGIDGAIPDSIKKIAYGTDSVNIWYWVSKNMDQNRPKFDIVAGVHDFRVYIRECGLRLDKFVLTNNPDYLPNLVYGEMGPPETSVSSVDDPLASQKSGLRNIYPNPFMTSTTISYNLRDAGNVTLDVYDILGHKVTTLVNEYKHAGDHYFTFNSDDTNYCQLTNGIYIIQLKADSQISRSRVLLMR